MAVAQTDPTQPRKLPNPLDPNQPANVNLVPNTGQGATGITQLSDGGGGAVAVPPPSMAPSWEQTIAKQPVGGANAPQIGVPSGPTDNQGRPLGPDGVYHPFSSPEFTVDPSGQVSTFQQPGGGWTNADGSPLAAGTDQWGRSTMTGTGMQPMSTAGVPNPSVGQPALTPGAPNVNPIPTAGAPGGAMPSTFSADQNLINAQINPVASARLLKTQGMTDDALSKVLNGPDRFQLAKGAYDDFSKLAEANLGRQTRNLTNAAAAHGQIGSGMLTNQYGDLNERYQLNDQLARSGFLRDAVEGTVGDRLNNLGAVRGVEGSIYGQEANDRSERRTERGYQRDLAEQAILRRIQQEQMERGQETQDFDQAARLYGLGQASDPTGAYQDAAGLATTEASGGYQDVGALLRLLAQRRNPVGG